MGYKFCKFCENRLRDTPLRGVYIPHFGQIWVKISVFGVLHPCRFTIGAKFGMKVPSSMPNFTPIGATTIVGHPKLKFLLRFDRNVKYKRPAGAYPLRDFHKICRVWTLFQVALAVKIWLDLLKGLWSYGGFKLRVLGFPQIFCAP